MKIDWRRLIRNRLESEGLPSASWSSLVLAACDGRDARDRVLQNTKAAKPAAEKIAISAGTGAYLTSLAVEGFRSIGPRQTLTLTVGSGLTIVGRNASGKDGWRNHAD